MKNSSRRAFLKESLSEVGAIFLGIEVFSPEKKRIVPEAQNNLKRYPSYLDLYEKGELLQRAERLFSIYENCRLCPRDCRVNRIKNQTGKCQASSKVKISSAFPHFGEERPLVGKLGSGTIFFSNCGLRCVYCQNYEISIEGEGVEISDLRLAESMIKLQKLGCHNINLVTPTHYVPNIVSALVKAIPMGLRIPLVYNTGGYDRIETLQLLKDVIDIYMPDCKYMDPTHSAMYSSDAYNYPHYCQIALKEMYQQTGDLKMSQRLIAKRGLVLRHLVLPNRIAGTEEFLKFVAENLSKTTYLNLMAQYRPEHKAEEYIKIARRLKRSEYEEALRWAKNYGFNRLAK
ncbi:radical SAM protein [Acidobacteriota bacterium]